MRKLAIYGAGGHGRVVAETASMLGWQEIVFFDDSWPQHQKNSIWPVQIRGGKKLKSMLYAAAGVAAQIEAIASFDSAAAEGAMHLVFQELDRHLGGHDLQLGV